MFATCICDKSRSIYNSMSKVLRKRVRDYVANVTMRVRSLIVSLLLVLLLIPTSNLASASPVQLDPISLSFPTTESGYVLSLYDCAAKTCAALRSTHNAGSSWRIVSLPSQLHKSLRLAKWGTYATAYQYQTLTVHFADPTNGWIYGTIPAPVRSTNPNPNWANRLWSTHNGGKSWSQIRLGPLSLSGGVIQMATHGETTYLFGASPLTDHAYILATPSITDQWTKDTSDQIWLPAGGTPLEGAFTFTGSGGWFVAGNDRGFAASARLSRNGSWNKWKGFPESSSFAPIVAVTSRVLLVEAASAGFVYPPASSVPADWNKGASWLFISYDAGARFKPLEQLSTSYGGDYYLTVSGLPAAPVPGTILLQQASGSGYDLEVSTNWGRSWRVVIDHAVSQVVFTSRTTGFAIVQIGHSISTLFRTTDAGRHWVEVRAKARAKWYEN